MAVIGEQQDPSLDIDRQTGADIGGWAHVVQSLEVCFTTYFGARVIREWFGSVIPRFLGENLNEQTIVAFFAALSATIEQWEPRFRVVRIVPVSVGRDGRFRIEIEGEYRPRALLGDFTPQGARRVTVFQNDTGLAIERLAA